MILLLFNYLMEIKVGSCLRRNDEGKKRLPLPFGLEGFGVRRCRQFKSFPPEDRRKRRMPRPETRDAKTITDSSVPSQE